MTLTSHTSSNQEGEWKRMDEDEEPGPQPAGEEAPDEDGLLGDELEDGGAGAEGGEDDEEEHGVDVDSWGGSGGTVISGTAGALGAGVGAGAQQAEGRVTTPFLTKFERARILGTRALQVSMNSPLLVQLEGESDPLEIAEKELKQRKIPFTVRRYLPDGSFEDWAVRELIQDDI